MECLPQHRGIADPALPPRITVALAHSGSDDAQQIAVLLRGGMLPQAYVYPVEMRATRYLLRQRMHLMRRRVELLTHFQPTNSQYNLITSRR